MYNQDLSRGSKSLSGVTPSGGVWEDPALKKDKPKTGDRPSDGSGNEDDDPSSDEGRPNALQIRRHSSYLPDVAKSVNSLSDVFMHKEQVGSAARNGVVHP